MKRERDTSTTTLFELIKISNLTLRLVKPGSSYASASAEAIRIPN